MLSFVAPFRLQHVGNFGKILRHDIATLNLPTVFAAALNCHIPLQTDAWVSSFNIIAVDGISSHVGLKCLIIAGQSIGPAPLVIGNIKAVWGKDDVSGKVFSLAFYGTELCRHFGIAHVDLNVFLFLHRSCVFPFLCVMGRPRFIHK